MAHEEIVHPEIAMVSRIRVEVRGETMKAAEAVAFMMLDHARLAGVFEGYVPSSGEFADHFFNRPEVTSKYGEPPEPWGELGLRYYGRLSFVFEPQSVFGGLRQIGYDVKRAGDGPLTPTDGDHGFIVLNRQLPVTREHTWEGVTSMLVAEETGEAIIDDIRSIRDVKEVEGVIGHGGASVLVRMDGWEDVSAGGETLREAATKARKAVIDMLEAGANPQATDDEIIANISRLIGVETVAHHERRIDQYPEPEGWDHRVVVTFNDEREAVEGRGKTKREAALNAYGKCGVDVTHFDTKPLQPGTPEHAAAERLAGV